MIDANAQMIDELAFRLLVHVYLLLSLSDDSQLLRLSLPLASATAHSLTEWRWAAELGCAFLRTAAIWLRLLL